MSSIGIDRSGNGNNWTSNNLTQYDVMVDSPTNNFCVLNPINNAGAYTYSEGNLTAYKTTVWNRGVGTMLMSTGKWYWEQLCLDQTYTQGGTALETDTFTNHLGVGSHGVGYQSHTGAIYSNSSTIATVATYTIGDVIGFALDMDNHTLQFFKNGSSVYTCLLYTSPSPRD